MRGFAIALLAMRLASTVFPQTLSEQDLPNGYVESHEPTSESYNEDSAIHGKESDRKYLTWKLIHEEKARCYSNLKKKRRKDYRGLTGELIMKYWKRGAMNDLYRICMLVSDFKSFMGKFEHDSAAHLAPPIESLKEVDETRIVLDEFGKLHRLVMSTKPGFRLIPLTNVKHFGSLPGNTQKSFAGMGALTLSYPEDETSTVKRRLERYYRWGRDYDEDRWKERLKDYRKEQGSIDPFTAMLGTQIVAFTKKTAEAGEYITNDTTFMKKIALFNSCFGDSNVEGHISQAIELLAYIETLQASFSRGAKGCGMKSRNQMSGLTLRIGSTLRVFLDNPCVGNMLAIGSIGVIGTPIVIDVNRNGRPDLFDDDWRPDTNVNKKATVYFDLDGDGEREAIEWLKADQDALLAIDLNGNGIVDDGHELFGATGGFRDGYEKLSRFDLDGNGKVEKEELAHLRLWIDNGDGLCTAEEIRLLGDFDIEALYTTHQGNVGHCIAAGESIMMWDWYTEHLSQ